MAFSGVTNVLAFKNYGLRTSDYSLLKIGLKIVARDDHLRSELWGVGWKVGIAIIDLELERHSIAIAQRDLSLSRGKILRLALLENQGGRFLVINLISDPTVAGGGFEFNHEGRPWRRLCRGLLGLSRR